MTADALLLKMGRMRLQGMSAVTSVIEAMLLQKSEVAGQRIFRENTKREATADSGSPSRLTEVACEFEVRR